MKKRIFSLILAVAMVITLAPSIFAAVPSDSVRVGASIDAKNQNSDFTDSKPTVGITDSSDNLEKAKFKVILSTAEIRKSIIDWHEFGANLIETVFDKNDPDEVEDYNYFMGELNSRFVKGNFTVTVALSDSKVKLPSAYRTTSDMVGFNDEAKIVFDEVSRTYNESKGTLTIKLKIKDNMRADELLKIAKLQEEGLGTLDFTVENVGVPASGGTFYVDGKLTGQTIFPGNSQDYPVNFYTNTVRANVTTYKTHKIDGDAKVNGFKDGNVVDIHLINYVTGQDIKLNVTKLDTNGNGFEKFHYTLPEGTEVKSGTYNIVIKVYETSAEQKVLATVTKIVTINDSDGDVHVSEAHLNIHREQNSSSGSNKKDETSYHPHDKFETKAEVTDPTHKKTTDENGNEVAVTPPVAGESDSATENHEADVAVEELKKDYEEEKATSDSKYEEKKNEVVQEVVDEGQVGDKPLTDENKGNLVVKEEIHSDRWVEGVYHENFTEQSTTTPEQAEVKKAQDAIKEEIDKSEIIKKPGDEPEAKPEDKPNETPEEEVVEAYVKPNTVFFEFTAYASDRIDYTVQLADENGNVIGEAETKTFYLDENKAFTDAKKRQVKETETVYEIVVNVDELAKTEKEFYELFASNKSVFVHREHDGKVEMFKMLSEGQIKNGKFIDATYYVDREKSEVHIFTRKFSEYGVTLADGNPPMYGEGTSVRPATETTVTFNIDGVTTEVAAISTSKTYIAFSSLPVPTKEGYEFDGWYLDSAMTQKVTKNIAAKGDMVLYGHWKNILIDTENHFAYVIGYEDGTVRAENNITRAEVATIFYRLLRDDVREKFYTTTNSFSDVNAGDWFNSSVSTMANGGFIAGYPDGTFGPNKKITRAEFATMATRFAVLNATDGKTFSDIAGHWGETYILKAATAGWIEGYPDGTFLPEKQITRAEAFAIINRVLVRVVDKAGIHKDATLWSDLEDKWYYCDVIEATNSHDYTRNADGKTETWTEMLPVPTWK